MTDRDKQKAMTIYDIAAEAGVSPSTVSRVLTNNAKVSPEKKHKVEEIISKYNYRPNALARGLSDTHTKTIGIMAADIRNPFYAMLFVECEKSAYQAGYTTLLCNSLGENNNEDKLLQMLYEKRVDAIIQIGGRVDEMVSDFHYVEQINRITDSIPVVVTGKLDGCNCYCVNIDELHAMETTIRYLLDLGHRKIALAGGRRNVYSTYQKYQKYFEMLNHYKIPIQASYVAEGIHYDEESGYSCMEEIFNLPDMPTAVIAISDFIAIGVVRSIKERGLSIPGDISVVSFDNTFVSTINIPKLTSVNYNYEEFGHLLISTAIQAINQEDVQKIQTITPELIIRDSCLPVS